MWSESYFIQRFGDRRLEQRHFTVFNQSAVTATVIISFIGQLRKFCNQLLYSHFISASPPDRSFVHQNLHSDSVRANKPLWLLLLGYSFPVVICFPLACIFLREDTNSLLKKNASDTQELWYVKMDPTENSYVWLLHNPSLYSLLIMKCNQLPSQSFLPVSFHMRIHLSSPALL